MMIQNLSEQVTLVTLPGGQQIIDELSSLKEVVSGRENCVTIIDFSNVEMITTVSINKLIILRNLLHKRGHRLILCSVSMPTRCIFTVSGLDGVFEFADDKDAAIAAIEQAN